MDFNNGPHAPFRSFSTSSSVSLHSSTTSITRISSGPLQAMNMSMNRQGSAKEHLYYQCEILKRKLTEIPEMVPFLSLSFNQAEQCAEQQALALAQQLQYDGGNLGSNIARKSSTQLATAGISSTSSSSANHNGAAPANSHNTTPSNDIHANGNGNGNMNGNGNGNGNGGAGGDRRSVNSQNFSIHSDTSAASNTTSSLFPSTAASNNNIFTFTAGVLPATLSADPVTQIWKLFQQGAPLCLLFNTVYPQKECHLPVIPSEDLRICKKSVYDFLIAVKTYLKFDDESMFTILNVFLDSTHDLIKIVKVINKVLTGVEVDDAGIAEVLISDDRSKVLKELIETERKYVQDLELLLQYKDELSNAELISNEQIHILFPNLNEIVDFQRRFLIGLECNNKVPNKYQRIGSIFIHAANGSFKAYEPWTIGQLAAIDLINKESQNLKKSSTLIDPGFELQSYIIKPIQRLCKYPLLLKELIKLSNNEIDNGNTGSFNELQMAQRSMKEVANQVNEAQRRAENVGYLHNLVDRVSNWRGFNLKDQGELLHHGVVSVKDQDVEKEYVAYLFEKIIFFFVEINPQVNANLSKKEKKNLLQNRKKSGSNAGENGYPGGGGIEGIGGSYGLGGGSGSSSSSTVNLLDSMNGGRDKSPLELKGRVYILEIYNISTLNTQGYTLVISWSGKKESGSFSLRYRTEEVRNQWESCLRNLKTVEMNNQIHRKLRDSSNASYESNNSSNNINSSYETYNGGDSNRQSYSSDQRHHSSSSTFSMMRFNKNKSGGAESALRQSSSSGTMNTISDKFSSTTLHDSSFSSSSTNSTGQQQTILIKLIYNHMEINELVVSSFIQFPELKLKISIKISSQTSEDIMINKLKYKDEDGDFVVMDSNDDWVLAVDMLEELNDRALTIWVS